MRPPTTGSFAPARRRRARRRNTDGPRRKLGAAEEKVEKFVALLARVDATLTAPDAFSRNPQEAARLAQQREELAKALASAEEQWLELASEAEGVGQ